MFSMPPLRCCRYYADMSAIAAATYAAMPILIDIFAMLRHYFAAAIIAAIIDIRHYAAMRLYAAIFDWYVALLIWCYATCHCFVYYAMLFYSCSPTHALLLILCRLRYATLMPLLLCWYFISYYFAVSSAITRYFMPRSLSLLIHTDRVPYDILPCHTPLRLRSPLRHFDTRLFAIDILYIRHAALIASQRHALRCSRFHWLCWDISLLIYWCHWCHFRFDFSSSVPSIAVIDADADAADDDTPLPLAIFMLIEYLLIAFRHYFRWYFLFDVAATILRCFLSRFSIDFHFDAFFFLHAGAFRHWCYYAAITPTPCWYWYYATIAHAAFLRFRVITPFSPLTIITRFAIALIRWLRRCWWYALSLAILIAFDYLLFSLIRLRFHHTPFRFAAMAPPPGFLRRYLRPLPLLRHITLSLLRRWYGAILLLMPLITISMPITTFIDTSLRWYAAASPPLMPPRHTLRRLSISFGCTLMLPPDYCCYYIIVIDFMLSIDAVAADADYFRWLPYDFSSHFRFSLLTPILLFDADTPLLSCYARAYATAAFASFYWCRHAHWCLRHDFIDCLWLMLMIFAIAFDIAAMLLIFSPFFAITPLFLIIFCRVFPYWSPLFLRHFSAAFAISLIFCRFSSSMMIDYAIDAFTYAFDCCCRYWCFICFRWHWLRFLLIFFAFFDILFVIIAMPYYCWFSSFAATRHYLRRWCHSPMLLLRLLYILAILMLMLFFRHITRFRHIIFAMLVSICYWLLPLMPLLPFTSPPSAIAPRHFCYAR